MMARAAVAAVTTKETVPAAVIAPTEVPAVEGKVAEGQTVQRLEDISSGQLTGHPPQLDDSTDSEDSDYYHPENAYLPPSPPLIADFMSIAKLYGYETVGTQKSSLN